MSRFFSKKYDMLTPYTPGEQPRDKSYIKLNTNESPFPPSPYAMRLSRQAAADLQLYSDPTCTKLVEIACEKYGVEKDEIIFTNGSDEILNFAFMAFCDEERPAAFPDITYGFYPVFAKLNNVPFEEIPLDDDFSIRVSDYIGINKNIFIANPNAPTGMTLPLCDIEKIVKSNPDNLVVIDEAYIDFGGESAIPLTKIYDNILVTRTFSKSYSLAGARLGFGIGSKKLIADINTIKYSTNPYNVNTLTMYAGIGALADESYFEKCIKTIQDNRAFVTEELKNMSFTVLDSKSNFLFAKTEKMGGKELYLALKEKGILVRHFDKERIKDYIRITIGDIEDMKTLLSVLEEIL